MFSDADFLGAPQQRHGPRHLSAPAQTGMTLHQCCPDNMMRTYFDYAGSQFARAADGALCVLMYTDGAVTLGGDRVEISGGYPWADGPVTVKATLAAPCKVRLRIPRWTATPSVERLNVEKLKVDGDWLEVEGRAGENAWLLRFDMAPRLVDWTASSAEDLPPSPQDGNDEIPEYTVHFMEWYTPEMANVSRREPAMRVLRGPLVLAKGRLAGTSREETLFASSLRGQGWRAAALRPAPRTALNAGVPQPWILVLERGGEIREIPVADFASVSNLDDPEGWFSLWF